MTTNRDETTAESGYQPDFMKSASFKKATFVHEWLIEGILVNNQPGVIGGAKKTLKTSIAVDMAISLGTGTRFLGKFKVPVKVRVAMLSGESGEATVQQTALRICEEREIDLADCDVFWSFDLPCLSRTTDRKRLKEKLEENKVQVVIIDPLYLCLLGGSKGVSASNLFEVGPVLQKMGQACLDAGATPILIHHANKGTTKTTDKVLPMILDDLSFSGIGEYVRQWLLINRRSPYTPGTSEHELLLAIGGSAGHSSCWEVDIDEGVLDDNFEGRKWCVTVRSDQGQYGHPGRRRRLASAFE